MLIHAQLPNIIVVHILTPRLEAIDTEHAEASCPAPMDTIGDPTVAFGLNEIIGSCDAYQVAFDQKCRLTGAPGYYLTLHDEIVSFRISGRVVRCMVPKSDPYGDRVNDILCPEYFIHADQSEEEQDLGKLFEAICAKLRGPVALAPDCMTDGTYKGEPVSVMKVRSARGLPRRSTAGGWYQLLRYARVCYSKEMHLYPIIEVRNTMTFVPVLVLGFIQLGPAELTLSDAQTIMGIRYEVSKDPEFTCA